MQLHAHFQKLCKCVIRTVVKKIIAAKRPIKLLMNARDLFL